MSQDTTTPIDRFNAARARASRAREAEAAIFDTIEELLEQGHEMPAVLDGLHNNMRLLNEAIYQPMANEPAQAMQYVGPR